MPNIGRENCEKISYEWYDTLEINGSYSGKRVQFFAAPQGQRSNLLGVTKDENYTNMTLASVLPEGETFDIRALRLHMYQDPVVMTDVAGNVYPDDKLLKAIVNASTIILRVQNKEYLTIPAVFIGAGCGVDVMPAIAALQQSVPAVDPIIYDKTSATNGVPSVSGLYCLSEPIALNNQEPFSVTLSFSAGLAGGFPDPVANPTKRVYLVFSLAGTLYRPVQ